MLTSFILPLAFFSIVLGAVWWFARGQRGQRPVAVRAATRGSAPAVDMPGGSTV